MIWLVGGNGMLGREIAETLKAEGLDFYATDLDVDITDFQALRSYAAGKDVQWIINAAAYTAVDRAESEEGRALAVNGTGPGCLGQVAHDIDARVIHFSTDYVFSGLKDAPYSEIDPVDPVSAYGRTKLAGENALQGATSKCFIFRISWLYGQQGGNFVATMLRLFRERQQLGVVADQFGAPTWTGMLARNVAWLIAEQSDKYGIYHYADEGRISWYDFAAAIYKDARAMDMPMNDVDIKPLRTEEYPTPARRPQNSSFDKTRVKALGFDVRPWRENLRQYLQQVQGTRPEAQGPRFNL